MIRVVQEALTNVRKHASGAAVSVDGLRRRAAGRGLVVVVEDTPGHCRPRPARHRTRSSASGGGYGLRGMRERAELLGGSLDAGPSDGGWRVELRVPVLAGAAAKHAVTCSNPDGPMMSADLR